MKTQAQNYFDGYVDLFKSYDDQEIITAFNREVGISGWGTARSAFLSAIHSEFNRRQLDYSVIGDQKTLSFKSMICLTGNKLELVTEKPPL